MLPNCERGLIVFSIWTKAILVQASILCLASAALSVHFDHSSPATAAGCNSVTGVGDGGNDFKKCVAAKRCRPRPMVLAGPGLK